jgi:hypothetical protein
MTFGARFFCVCVLVGVLTGALACQDPVGVSPGETPLPFVILFSGPSGSQGSPVLTVHESGFRLVGSSLKSESGWAYSARLLPSPPGAIHIDVLATFGGAGADIFWRTDYQIDVAKTLQGEQLRVLWTETAKESATRQGVFLVLDTTVVSQ